MAIMHPKNLSNFNATKSEREMFAALEEQLDNSYHVFYSVTWYTEENGERKNSECDFLVFNSNYGYLTIEVKGGTKIEVNDGEWTLYSLNEKKEIESRKLKKSPYKQAESSMHYFRKYYQKETLTNFRGTFGMAVAFPFFSVGVDLENDAPKELTIQLSDMNNLDYKIRELFHYWGGKNGGSFLSDEQAKKFINLVNRRVALSIAAGALIPITSKKLESINLIQDSIITLLENYKRVQIVGGAGTGKTWIAIKKLIQQSKLGKNCLYTCYSPILADFVRAQLPDNVRAIDIESLFRECLTNNQIKLPTNEQGDTMYFDILQDVSRKKYDCIMVDEAQDFSLDWALTLNGFLSEDGWFYVFYDENQNIYSRKFEDGFMIESEPYLLTNNIRNTRNIHTWVKDKTAVGEQVISNDVFGSDPEVYSVKDLQGAKIRLNEVLNKLVLEECVDPQSIVVLGRENLETDEYIGSFVLAQDIENKHNGILYHTVQDYKGLEANVVIYLNSWPAGIPKSKEYYDLLYIAGTRAKYYLYVIEYKT
jgi:hypothetical protein